MANDHITLKFITRCKQFCLYNPNPKFSFGYWFGQFWTEAIGSGGKNDPGDEKMKKLLALVYASLFPTLPTAFSAKKAAGDTAVSSITQLPQPTDLTTRPLHYREILQLALDIGYRPLVATSAAASAGRDQTVSSGYKQDFYKRLLKHRLQYGSGTPMPVAIGFRGEGRGFDTVSQHGGMLNRVDLINQGSTDVELRKLNIHETWHPWSDPRVGGQMYLRLKKGDNCLMTVTSIAQGLRVPVGFPLIEDEEQYTFYREKPLKDWTFADYKKPRVGVKVAKVLGDIGGRNRQGICLVTNSHLYAAKFTGNTANLANTQETVVSSLNVPVGVCKERAVRGFPFTDLLAGVKLQRVHLGPTRTCGVVATIMEKRYAYNGRWHSTLDMQQFAASHFAGDLVAANQAVQVLSKMLYGKNGSGMLYGELDPGVNNTTYPTSLRIDILDMDFKQFDACRYFKDVYYG